MPPKEEAMKRITTVGLTIVVLALTAGPALADPGAPGTTFPEQPGSNPQGACVALLSNPGAPSAPRAGTAAEITNGLVLDACFGG
jgi:hypothetical protein